MDKEQIKICKLCRIPAEKHFSKFGIFGIYLGCHFPSQKKDSKKEQLTERKTN
jgi:hypothetical protein